ncbi:MAG TPA: peptidylprolyl isomerase [Gammaproteobacteria bacterium]|nr:peptidylprolyl isomerase [Gammaproteobacteria bacterium]
MILMTTSLGEIEIELFADKAPVTVENFLAYVDAGFYDGTIFHRVIADFMVQCGGFTPDMVQKKGRAPIRNEADNGLSNEPYTLAMARTSDIHSATSQFFINLADNTFLDHGKRDFGYAVFGKVSKGSEVVDRIAEVRTANRGGHGDVPVDAVVIQSIKRVDA